MRQQAEAEHIEKAIGISEHYTIPKPLDKVVPFDPYIKILKERERSDLANSLHLPDGLYPSWKIDNSLYDIYYIPGYDNYMYETVKKDPKLLQNLSEYKRAYFEHMLKVQNPALYDKYMRDKMDKADFLPTITGQQMSKTMSVAAAEKLDPYTGRGQINTAGFYPSKRERLDRDGILRSDDPDNKLVTGTEFWQTTYQNANQTKQKASETAGGLGTTAENQGTA